jgi:hypothetical protein
VKQIGDVVEADGHLGMIGAESPLGYSQRSRVKWLGLRKSVRRARKLRIIVEERREVGMIGAKAPLLAALLGALKANETRQPIAPLAPAGPVPPD